MDLASVEDWRLCPECQYMQKIDAVQKDNFTHCPRCGTSQWQDGLQKHNLLRFRQVIATTEDANSRIDDRIEEREPKFYVRQMMIDFEEKDIREAWKLKEDLPFSFEFISHSLPWSQFWRAESAGSTNSVASSLKKDLVLNYGGKVQSNYFRNDGQEQEKPQDHAIDCSQRDSNDDGGLVSLHLYQNSVLKPQDFGPLHQDGVDEQIVQSFIAALQLFKLQFGGRVDHYVSLNRTYRPKTRRRHYILYDSVPGGTGYLHQLLSEQAQTMMDLLVKSHTPHGCSCAQDLIKTDATVMSSNID